jgi:hypothetical protein
MALFEHTTAWKPRLEAFQEQGAGDGHDEANNAKDFAGVRGSSRQPTRTAGGGKDPREKNPGNARERT